MDAVLVVTPYYNKPNERGLRAHFEACAEAAGDVPVLLYNIPGRCVINLEPDLLVELSKVRNIVGIKQANADMGAARRIVEDCGLALYAGDDNLLRPFAEIGGAGGICVSSHLAGERMKEVYEAARAGDTERRARSTPSSTTSTATLFIAPPPGDGEGGAAPARLRGRRRAAADGRGGRRRAGRAAQDARSAATGRRRREGLKLASALCGSCRSAGSARSART